MKFQHFGTDKVMKDRWLAYLLIGSLAYLVILITVGRLPCVFTDELAYKASGREWAATGRFASPELRGFMGLDPPVEKVWLIYPPLYPLLFGCFVKVFGFGWRACVSFDALIHAGLALLTFGVARGLSANADPRAAFWAGLAVLPLGVAGRPDELAICFGMAGLLPLLRSMADAGRTLSLSSVVASGALFGLCAGTSHPALVILGLIALVFLVARAGTVERFVGLSTVWAGTTATVSTAMIVPLLVKYPDAYQQYLGVWRTVVERTKQPYWSRIANLMSHEARVLFFPVLGILLLSLATVVSSRRSGALRRWMLLWLGPFAGAAVLLIAGVHSACYTWFLGPYVLAAAAVTLTDPRLAPQPPVAYIARAAVVLLVLFGSIETAKQTIVLATLPSTQTMDYNARQVRDLIPRGSKVAAYDAWWFLGSDYNVYDFGWSAPEHWNEVDYVVVQDHPLPAEFEDYVQKHFRLIYDNRSRASATVFGVPISRVHTGFGARVFARRSIAAHSITQVVETLLGGGFDIKIFDPDVSVSRLRGKNLAYVDRHLPHLAALLVEDPRELYQHGSLMILGSGVADGLDWRAEFTGDMLDLCRDLISRQQAAAGDPVSPTTPFPSLATSSL
jgi:hypothetical protein